jgi:hypothetical protein
VSAEPFFRAAGRTGVYDADHRSPA